MSNSIGKRIKALLLPSPGKWQYFLIVSLLIKAVAPFFAAFFFHKINPSFWGIDFGPDVESYFDPIENFLKSGIYSPDHRMPGYGAVFFVFRQIFTYTMSCNLVGVLQLAVSAISVYYLALTTGIVFKSKSAFYTCYYIFLISTFSNYYDVLLSTESLSTSFLIFSAYFMSLFFFKKKLSAAFFSGLFLTWVVFMRPAFAPVFLIYVFLIFLIQKKNKRNILKPIIAVAVLFCMVDGVWTYRNYKVEHTFAPLANGVFYPYYSSSYFIPMCNFVQSWGGARYIPDPPSAMSWFGGTVFPAQDDYRHYDSIKGFYDSVPANVYTSQFNRDSIIELRKLTRQFIDLQKPTVDSIWKASGYNLYKAHSILYYPLYPRGYLAYLTQLKVIERFNRYTNSIKQEHKFLYYVVGPLRLTSFFLFKPEDNGPFKRFHFIPYSQQFFTLFYYVFLIIGLVGALLLLIKGFGNYGYWLIASIPLSMIFIHPMLMRAALNRYIIPIWPFIIACAVYTIIISSKVLKQKLKPKSI